MARTQVTLTVRTENPGEGGYYMQHGDSFSGEDYRDWFGYMPTAEEDRAIDAAARSLAPGQWLEVEYTPDQAHIIAARLQGRWEDENGVRMDQLVAQTWTVPPVPEQNGKLTRYECLDGSAIVESPAGYDVEGPVRWSWAGAGATAAQLAAHVHNTDAEQAPGSETRLLAEFMVWCDQQGYDPDDEHTIVPDDDVQWWLGAYNVQGELFAAQADGLIEAAQVANAMDTLQDAVGAPQVRFVVENSWETVGDPAPAYADTAADAGVLWDRYREDVTQWVMQQTVEEVDAGDTMETAIWASAAEASAGHATYTRDAAQLVVLHAVSIDVQVL